MESLSAITSTPPRANTREPVPEKNRREGCKRIPDCKEFKEVVPQMPMRRRPQ
jgi:hypothetical protein